MRTPPGNILAGHVGVAVPSRAVGGTSTGQAGVIPLLFTSCGADAGADTSVGLVADVIGGGVVLVLL